MERFDIVPREPKRLVATLSGGNRQKTALAKWMRLELQVLILDEPTQNVDVGAKAQIHDFIREAAGRGVAVVLISSDYRELANLCDRVHVMASGKLGAELVGEDGSEDRIEELVARGSALLAA
jgi:ribose transport system ATP-binding protein